MAETETKPAAERRIRTAEDEMAERFPKEVADHELEILRDDGLYRHLRFLRVTTDPETGKRSKSSFYWFDLVTWPGWLTVAGDCGTFVFSRIEDMFEFFRGSRINPDYWGEKAQGDLRLKRYSEERFRQHVLDIASEREDEYPGLTAAVTEAFFGSPEYNTEYEPDVRRALADFEFGTTVTAECTCGGRRAGLSEDEASTWRISHRASAPSLSGTHRITDKRVDGFRFTDTWEWDLGDWDWQFLWCCHAIQWGISRYDAAKARTPAPAEVTP